jgi:hypothetical protein
MMKREFQRLRHRAIETGLRRTEKLQHPLSREEILALRVQVLPASARILMAGSGILLIIGAIQAWPSDSNVIRSIEGVGGFLLALFGTFGIRRSLEAIGDRLGESILESIIEGISGAIDF